MSSPFPTFYCSSKPLFGVRCVRRDSLRFLAHLYSKVPKFFFLNPKNIIPAKVHLRLRISSSNMFHRISHRHGRLPCKFELNLSSTAKLRSVFLKSSRKTPKPRFFDVFWPKTKFFSSKVANFIIGSLFTIK